jgi:hypothetical protein
MLRNVGLGEAVIVSSQKEPLLIRREVLSLDRIKDAFQKALPIIAIREGSTFIEVHLTYPKVVFSIVARSSKFDAMIQLR